MNFFKKTIIFILNIQAKTVINKYKPYIIAVTGSVGKTTTKDAIFALIAKHKGYVRKSDKSMNSEIGLPLTILGIPNAWKDINGWLSNIIQGFKLILCKNVYPDCLVLEIGADHPDDIKKVTKWLKPDIAVITKISATPVHVEFFDSPQQVFEEKASLAQAVKKGGSVILFADDDKTMSMVDLVRNNRVNIISFGLNSTATINSSQLGIEYDVNGMPSGMKFIASVNNSSYPVLIKGVLGQTYVYPILAGMAVGSVLGISPDDMISSISKFEAPKGRMNILKGINNSVIIDDTYNSSPDACISALQTLAEVRSSGAKIAILGDMMELGKYSSDEHRKIGKYVPTVANILVTIGPRSRVGIADQALLAGMSSEHVRSFDTSSEAGDYIKTIIKPGDVILVKGSQSTRAERTVKSILDQNVDASDVLVRQEKEWLDKV